MKYNIENLGPNDRVPRDGTPGREGFLHWQTKALIHAGAGQPAQASTAARVALASYSGHESDLEYTPGVFDGLGGFEEIGDDIEIIDSGEDEDER